MDDTEVDPGDTVPNQASEKRRSTDRAPVVSRSPNVPGPDAANSRHSA
ncbi:hypothetical protein [Dactylosporangium fulvum]|uniref:Uncharacterized protein n=1 Tax=Dactylosporangium fulvum TaxID=53359 RepID=A0ABY5W8R3_9ACTN|nr:hypothetical protein [Dactylosporangium fulvum]UWP86267.1 hypothetical protein Dfulv_19295 [Dactylosporangium fulvum]